MVMKLARILCPLAVVMTPQLVNAEIPFTAQSMANLQATIDFCGKSEPKEAAKFQELIKQLVQSLPAKEVASVLESDDYKSAYETISDALESLAEPQADETCQRLLHPKK
jgi:hypothetical protein